MKEGNKVAVQDKKDGVYAASKRKKGGAQRTVFTFREYVVLFLAVAAVATVSILSSQAINEASDGNKIVTALATGAILVALSAALCAAGVLYRKFCAEKPVKIILDATEKMARGDFDVNLTPRHPWGRYDEFDVIFENVNRMAAELSKTEILRSDFIANVSHEIKTPLSVIQSYASALLSESPDESRRREYASALVSASRRLTALVTDILRLNKMENQKIFPQKRPFDAGELLRECALGFEEKLDEKGLELECDIDDVAIVSDSGFLEIIFNNLISNAVKFTEEGGRISLTLKKEGGYVLFTVRDDGCGMSAETGAHIFDKFYQGDTSRSAEGNGLGLALVKRAIDILGGEIAVESRLGEGTTFRVRLFAE